jgi:hypothetical protein
MRGKRRGVRGDRCMRNQCTSRVLFSAPIADTHGAVLLSNVLLNLFQDRLHGPKGISIRSGRIANMSSTVTLLSLGRW